MDALYTLDIDDFLHNTSLVASHNDDLSLVQ